MAQAEAQHWLFLQVFLGFSVTFLHILQIFSSAGLFETNRKQRAVSKVILAAFGLLKL